MSRTRLTADTSSQPQGLTRRVVLNILEAFFRRPVLHLIPLFMMLGVAAASVINMNDEFASVGTLSVTNESLLADLTNAQQTSGFSFEGPATVTAREINERLRTDRFLDAVIVGAGLEEVVESGQLTRQQIRSFAGASADGDNLVRVGATSGDPELSFRIADAVITSYRESVIAADVAQSTSTEQSLATRVEEKQQAVDAADEALRAEILAQPDVEVEERSLIDQQDFAQLQAQAERARTQLVAAEDALDAAKLQTAQAEAIVAQRLQVLDPPERQLVPAGRLRNAAMNVIIFGVLGLVLSLVSVVISAMLDRTIRVPEDISSKFGIDVLAVVPETAR